MRQTNIWSKWTERVFIMYRVPFFYCVATANMKDNAWQDLLLNERFMIQRCVLMAELQSVMRR